MRSIVRQITSSLLNILLVASLIIGSIGQPAQARFISPDDWNPTQEGVGTNRYAYAQNDPVNRSDPNGHLAPFVIPVIVGAIFSLFGGTEPANAPATKGQVVVQTPAETATGMVGGACMGAAASCAGALRGALGLANTKQTERAKDTQRAEQSAEREVGASKAEPPPYARDKYSRPGEQVRRETLKRDADCVYCGKNRSDTVDHVRSQKQDWVEGGFQDPKEIRSGRVNQPDNLAGACKSCNSSKGSRKLGVEWIPPKDR